jgi:trehalose 6-phosphate synthase
VRTLLRWGLPLFAVLGGLAWGASALVHSTTRSWFERDVSMRARLAVSGARDALADHLRSNDRRKLRLVLTDLTRDDRIMASAACTLGMRTVVQVGAALEGLSCEALAEKATSDERGTEWVAEVTGGLVHVAVLPVFDEGGAAGHAMVVHDLSFLARREASVRRFTLGAFGFVALLASVLTVVVRRASWRSWTEELRRMLPLPGLGAPRRAARARKEFRPLLADVHQLVSDLAAEQSGAAAGRWSAERLRRTLEETLHGDRVVILANREPYIHVRGSVGPVRVQHPASGLVTALEPVMRACGGVWVAHGGGSADREVVDAHDRIRVPPGEESYALRRVWLSQEEERGYYYGFSNEGLWPLCHLAHTRPMFRVQDYRHYEQVNRRFAEAVCEEVAGPDPIVLVQDYHYALAPRMIRERLPRATIITFWHIPWPNAERLGICPWAKDLIEGLLGSSIVGFHTRQHCNNFVEGVDRFLEARIDREKQSVVLHGRETLIRPYPISIEWPSRWAAEAPPPAECRREVLAELGLPRDTLLGIGVDRLDYTKGIEERLLAVERLLERFPHLRGRFAFVQLAAPSRTLIPEYRELGERVEALAARVNARFAGKGAPPIVLHQSHHEPPAVFRYLRAANLCYVSSLHDGMNLVAKEFVAAREDPYDLEEASSALAAALAMSAAEQAERMRTMRAFLQDLNVHRWAGKMLTDAARLRQRDRLTSKLGTTTLRPVDDLKA